MTTAQDVSHKTRRRRAEVEMLEQAVLDRLAAEPASFQDLIDEGVLTRSTAATVLRRLKRKGTLREFGYRKAGVEGAGRGKPRVLYALTK